MGARVPLSPRSAAEAAATPEPVPLPLLRAARAARTSHRSEETLRLLLMPALLLALLKAAVAKSGGHGR